ncbi:MAG: carboxypeptidase-like regulatory domain-containing protein [Planctomycetaceae bacterium]|jgi:hypothetical protein|nr:carboxypeptidase-like regulatory domain-containing protein [Planctomycetaceae bacterium]
MMRNYTFIFVYLLLVCLAGCGDSSRPNDLPKLFPCIITITQDDKPLPDAVVKLIPQTDTEMKYRPVAVTDTDGIVKMSTYGFAGVPAGKYKIVVIKNIDDDIVYRNDDVGERSVVSYNTYRVVEKRFSDTATTPYEIEITPKSKNIPMTFDVGKTIKERI